MGYFCLDSRTQYVIRNCDVHHAQLGCLRRPAGCQEEIIVAHNGSLCGHYSRIGAGGAGQRGIGDSAYHFVQYVLFLWRVFDGCFPARVGQARSFWQGSGWGWSFGYFGGMLALGLSLGYVLWAQSQNISADKFVPVTMLITAVVYGTAATATFWLLGERATPNPSALRQSGFKASLAQLNTTFKEARRFKDFMWFLACGVFYQGGVAVAITLAAIYAEQVIGFLPQETMVLIFVLNIAAAVGAFGFGYFQDKVGHKLALGITLVGWTATCVIAAVTTTKGGFWYVAAIAGFCMGSSQSAGRAMAGLFAPPKQLGEFFGLWTFATRLASIIGPLSYGAITWMTGGNQRIAIMSTSVLFLAGLLLLLPVNVQRGREAALRQAA